MVNLNQIECTLENFVSVACVWFSFYGSAEMCRNVRVESIRFSASIREPHRSHVYYCTTAATDCFWLNRVSHIPVVFNSRVVRIVKIIIVAAAVYFTQYIIIFDNTLNSTMAAPLSIRSGCMPYQYPFKNRSKRDDE